MWLTQESLISCFFNAKDIISITLIYVVVLLHEKKITSSFINEGQLAPTTNIFSINNVFWYKCSIRWDFQFWFFLLFHINLRPNILHYILILFWSYNCRDLAFINWYDVKNLNGNDCKTLTDFTWNWNCKTTKTMEFHNKYWRLRTLSFPFFFHDCYCLTSYNISALKLPCKRTCQKYHS